MLACGGVPGTLPGVSKDAPGVRYAEVERESDDNIVRVVLDLDGERQATVDTGVVYFDQLLAAMAFHGKLDLGVSVDGSGLDGHRTVEEVGVCFGQAIRQAIGEADSIDRFGTCYAPADGALARVVIDISGRPHVVFDASFSVERVGDMSAESIEQFFRAIANHALVTIHIHELEGNNNHHLSEAIFKAFGRALREAVHRADIKPKNSKGRLD